MNWLSCWLSYKLIAISFECRQFACVQDQNSRLRRSWQDTLWIFCVHQWSKILVLLRWERAKWQDWQRIGVLQLGMYYHFSSSFDPLSAMMWLGCPFLLQTSLPSPVHKYYISLFYSTNLPLPPMGAILFKQKIANDQLFCYTISSSHFLFTSALNSQLFQHSLICVTTVTLFYHGDFHSSPSRIAELVKIMLSPEPPKTASIWCDLSPLPLLFSLVASYTWNGTPPALLTTFIQSATFFSSTPASLPLDWLYRYMYISYFLVQSLS